VQDSRFQQCAALVGLRAQALSPGPLAPGEGPRLPRARRQHRLQRQYRRRWPSPRSSRRSLLRGPRRRLRRVLCIAYGAFAALTISNSDPSLDHQCSAIPWFADRGEWPFCAWDRPGSRLVVPGVHVIAESGPTPGWGSLGFPGPRRRNQDPMDRCAHARGADRSEGGVATAHRQNHAHTAACADAG
jgi:hypothetical protein